jgi:hypothetical protein
VLRKEGARFWRCGVSWELSAPIYRRREAVERPIFRARGASAAGKGGGENISSLTRPAGSRPRFAVE